jgi:hypothetical protein
MDDLIGILQRIDRRLVGIADTLSYDGRLTVVKSIISAIPNYGMCILKLPLGFLDHVDNSSRNFFWKGKDIEQKGKCLVKWENVCKPKKAGGLGVLNLRTQNIALLLKFLFKFMNRQDIPWVQLIWQAHYSNGKIPQSSNACGSFWWKDCLSLLGTFLHLAHCKAGNGDSVRAWLDCWSDSLLSHRFPISSHLHLIMISHWRDYLCFAILTLLSRPFIYLCQLLPLNSMRNLLLSCNPETTLLDQTLGC